MKKFIALLLVAVMCFSLGIGGTVAYLTDRETETNVFTVGDVDIELNDEFKQGSKLLPGVVLDKNVSIKNVGTNDAWVFYTYAIPAAIDVEGVVAVTLDNGGDNAWADKSLVGTVKIPETDGIDYNVYVVAYNPVLKPNTETPVSFTSIALSSAIDSVDGVWATVVNGAVTKTGWPADKAPIVYVNAYAIQKEEFANVEAAIDAYTTQWNGFNATYDEPTLVATAEELTAALANGESVALTDDVTVASTIKVLNGSDVKLNLNGHKLSYAVSNTSASAIINVEPKAALEITGEGTISFVAANPDMQEIPGYATNTITNEGTLVIGEGVVVTNGSDGSASYAVDNKGKFTLNGGTLIGKVCALRIAKYNQDNVEFVMNGGLVKAATPAWIQLPGSSSADAPTITVTINDGTFQSTKTPSSADNNVLYTYSFGNSHANTSITINGGMFLGGTVSIGSGYKGDAPALTINGGTFEYDVMQWLKDDGSQVLYNASGIKSVSTTEELEDAIEGGETTIILGSGNYIIPDSAQGKTLTIVGNGDTVVANQNDGSYEGCDYSLDGATVTFENVTITTDGHTYAGYARCNATYNNCTINGSYTLYGESVFNNCTFNVEGDYYNIWTWGGKKVEFNNCTFNTDGKSVLVYNQSCDVYVNGCTFNDRTNGTGFTKSALETGVDGVGPKYNIYIKDTTFNGFAENDKCVGYKNIVGNKNSMTNEYLNIVVDGVDVY